MGAAKQYADYLRAGGAHNTAETLGYLDDLDKACAERDALKARLDDYEDDHRAVVVGQCAPDESHCSCVPHLRREVDAMRGVEAAARAINGILNGDVTEEMRAITDALRALDAVRTRKAGG